MYSSLAEEPQKPSGSSQGPTEKCMAYMIYTAIYQNISDIELLARSPPSSLVKKGTALLSKSGRKGQPSSGRIDELRTVPYATLYKTTYDPCNFSNFLTFLKSFCLRTESQVFW